MNLSWTPRRRGKIYCSSACGGDCKWAAHVKAKLRAKALAKSLGAQWKPRVWENLGWHYSVSCGDVVVHPYSFGGYWAAVNGPIQFTASAQSAKGAVVRAIERAKKLTTELAKMLSDVNFLIRKQPRKR
jgi:hypothetical protein